MYNIEAAGNAKVEQEEPPVQAAAESQDATPLSVPTYTQEQQSDMQRHDQEAVEKLRAELAKGPVTEVIDFPSVLDSEAPSLEEMRDRLESYKLEYANLTKEGGVLATLAQEIKKNTVQKNTFPEGTTQTTGEENTKKKTGFLKGLFSFFFKRSSKLNQPTGGSIGLDFGSDRKNLYVKQELLRKRAAQLASYIRAVE